MGGTVRFQMLLNGFSHQHGTLASYYKLAERSLKIFFKMMGGSRESPGRAIFSSHHILRTVLKWKRGNKKLTDVMGNEFQRRCF